MSKNDNIIVLYEAQLREHLDRKITESVEDTLYAQSRLIPLGYRFAIGLTLTGRALFAGVRVGTF